MAKATNEKARLKDLAFFYLPNRFQGQAGKDYLDLPTVKSQKQTANSQSSLIHSQLLNPDITKPHDSAVAEEGDVPLVLI